MEKKWDAEGCMCALCQHDRDVKELYVKKSDLRKLVERWNGGDFCLKNAQMSSFSDAVRETIKQCADELEAVLNKEVGE